MPRTVKLMADLTAVRDRQTLDSAMLATLDALVQPERAGLYRLVGPGNEAHWLTVVEMQSGRPPVRVHDNEVEMETLPLAQDCPQRMLAIALKQHLAPESSGQPHVFPLVATQGGTPAVVELHGNPLTPDQTALVEGVLRLYQNLLGLLDYGERDALTELLNRKTFDGAFLRATTGDSQEADPATPERRHSLPGASYWLALLDIDHFKRVNDTYGHLIGDEVLLLLARLMRANFRFHDQLYRFGGEEFVVLMHCPDQQGAIAALQRLRTTTENHAFPQVGHITISIGVTMVRQGDTPSAAIERADKAVYYAKEHGRNQVCAYEQLVAAGLLAEADTNVGDVELF